MNNWKRNFGWIEHCRFNYHEKDGVIKASIYENPLVYKVLTIVNNLAFVCVEPSYGGKLYYTFSMAKKPLMGMVSCMPVGYPYHQKKRAMDNFEYFKTRAYHPEYDFGEWWK